jgi:riboflavin kinase/FMN adenylyltransferase
MKIVSGRGSLERGPKGPKALAIGVFDGVHLGHQKILRTLCRVSRRRGLQSAVLTFKIHPTKTLSHQEPVLHLSSLQHKLLLLEREGVDVCYVMDFSPAFAQMEPAVFLEDILMKKIGMRALVVGEDFVFGRDARGGVPLLRRYSRQGKFFFKMVRQVKTEGAVVSSTRIRRLIASGDLRRAQRLLGRPVSLLGDVVRGDGRGRMLGFPTANLKTDHEVLLPDGVYATMTRCGACRQKSVTYIGTKPTFLKKPVQRNIEIFIFDFKKNIYGHMLEVVFIKKIRPDKKFPDTACLVAQMELDTRVAKKLLKHIS